jgi:hypothetical protein
MMFTVSGALDGVPYRVGVYPGEPDEVAATGCVAGSAAVRLLLIVNTGRKVAVTPTGPFVTVDPADPYAVLAALYALTTVVKIDDPDGEAPQVLPSDDGVIY